MLNSAPSCKATEVRDILSTVGLSKCKKQRFIQPCYRGASDRPSRQTRRLRQMGQTGWSAILHSGLAAAFLAVFISARRRLGLPGVYMRLMQGGDRRTNYSLTFTCHWITFFGTRVPNCDLSLRGMIHAFVSRCQKEKGVIIICLCV